MRWVRVYAGMDESFDVVFTDDGKPLAVKRIQTVWSINRGAPSNLLSEPVRCVIERARVQLGEDEEDIEQARAQLAKDEEERDNERTSHAEEDSGERRPGGTGFTP